MSTKQTFETNRWPMIPAKWFTPVATSAPRDIRLIVIHCMENPEKGTSAEDVGLFFQRGAERSSAHIGVDSDSVIRYVEDNFVAYAAPGVNSDGIHIELAGTSKQTRAEWEDPYSTLMIERAADVAAQYCLKYDIPPIKLSNLQLRTRFQGIIGHDQATDTYKPNSGHADPGPAFPWAFFIKRVVFHYDRRKPA